MKILLASLVLVCAALVGCAELQRIAPLELYEPNAKGTPIVVDVGDVSLACFSYGKLLRFVVVAGDRVVRGGCDDPIMEPVRKGTPL